MFLSNVQVTKLFSILEEARALLAAAASPFSKNTLDSTYVRVADELSEMLAELKQA